jgi:riboflavin kinase/FMN adenylyltransferase
MQVHFGFEQLPTIHNAVVTIGTFDGVHAGHQQIIRQLKEEAAFAGGQTVIITFHPHPRAVLSTTPPPLLNTLSEKLFLLELYGIHHVVVVPFDAAFAGLTAEAYVQDFLWARFKPHTLIIGYDHRFGQGRKGDYHLLEAMGRELGFAVKEIPGQVIEHITISSTNIRQALGKGEADTANRLLGYPYFFEGEVVKGNQLGRTIGYPTANIRVRDAGKLVPANGVYVVAAQVVPQPGTAPGIQKPKSIAEQPQNSLYRGMMNIGVRPTVDGLNKVIEVHLFDFDRDIYGQTLQVQVLHRLRNEQKFNGLEELKTQLAVDKAAAMQFKN